VGARDRVVVGRPELVATTPVLATVASPTAAPVPRLPLEIVTGEAAYYARKFEGRRTASGVPFRNAEMVAAHRRYPFGTVLRVTNMSNERSVEVTVVDRGPYGSRVRILDLSRAAADRLDYIEEGHAEVKVEVLSWGNRSGG
jgi:rare lipoprotein A